MARSRDLKVGIFVLVGLALLGMTIFLIGEERNLFSASVNFKTTFTDAQGLKPGAPVRLGGIDVGQVAQVGYDQKSPDDPTVYVTFWVKRSEMKRVRTDTRAAIVNKGLLGDKMVELSLGEGEAADPETTLQSDKPQDMFGRIGDMADKAEAVLDNVEKATKPLGDEKLHRDIQGSVASIHVILHEIANGQGYPTRLLKDPKEAERISGIMKNLEGATKEAEGTLKDARRVMGRVETGPGFAHDVIYGEGPRGLAEFQSAANEVALTLRGVREGDGLLKDVMYGGKGDGAVVFKNVADITTDLKAIIADVRAGKGTIGGLLVDPSVYEDVKVVLGNVQRNDVLRALVRYSITKDQPKTQVNVAGPSAPAPPAAPAADAVADK